MPKEKYSYTIVIPTLNEEKNIQNTISALKKMQPDARIVIADGKSTDHTVEIARKLGAKAVFEEHGEKFKSIAAGRNAGARAAGECDILLFIDADTIPEPQFFNRMLKEFQDERVVGVGCKIMPSVPEHEYFTNWTFELFNLMIFWSVVASRPSIAGNCVAYRTKEFWKIKGFDEEMHASEDQDLCVRISKYGRVIYMRGVTAYTSSRRLRHLGWFGLLKDWGKNTLYFLIGKKITRYAIIREI